jgi:hypothetical protein
MRLWGDYVLGWKVCFDFRNCVSVLILEIIMIIMCFDFRNHLGVALVLPVCASQYHPCQFLRELVAGNNARASNFAARFFNLRRPSDGRAAFFHKFLQKIISAEFLCCASCLPARAGPPCRHNYCHFRCYHSHCVGSGCRRFHQCRHWL